MFLFQVRGGVVSRNNDRSSRSRRNNCRLFTCALKHPRVDELVREESGEQWNVEALGVRPMQQGNRESVVEELRIDAISRVGGDTLQIAD